jgi:hypothetical protein
MGTYNLTTLKANLKFELGQFSAIDSYLTDWVNSAYLDFCTKETFWNLKLPAKLYFPEMLKVDSSKATAANTKFVTLPTDCISIYHIHDTTNDAPLDYYEVREYARKTGHNVSTSYGKPKKWTRIGGRLYFHPTADGAYALDIFYRKRPGLLVNATDTTEVDTIWDEPILKLAVYQSLMRLKRYDMADVERKEWIEAVAGKIGIYSQDKRSSRTPIEPDYAYKMAGRV